MVEGLCLKDKGLERINGKVHRPASIHNKGKGVDGVETRPKQMMQTLIQYIYFTYERSIYTMCDGQLPIDKQKAQSRDDPVGGGALTRGRNGRGSPR